jgi:hypothetical protein
MWRNGVRTVTGSQSIAFMVDFLHNKAVSRLGQGRPRGHEARAGREVAEQ